MITQITRMSGNYFKEQFDTFCQYNKDLNIICNSEVFALITATKKIVFYKKYYDSRLLDYMESEVGICPQCKDYCTRWFLLARKKLE